jgi:ribonuclease BN (tRNA processing enzyme)
MKLHVLGSGTPQPNKERWGSGFIVELKDELLMFDCGPASTYKMIQMDLDPRKVGSLFFTHHHSDHDLDYPTFLLTRWETSIGQELELEIFGPPPTVKFTEKLINIDYGAFAHDLIARTNHSLSLNSFERRGGKLPRKLPSFKASDIKPGDEIKRKGWAVKSALAEHVEPFLDSLAYRLETQGKSIVFTGDTRPCKTVEKLAYKADYLICLCIALQDQIDGTPEADYMMGHIDAGMLARNAEVKNLILVHEALNISSEDNFKQAINDIGKIFNGNVIQSYEMTTYNLV